MPRLMVTLLLLVFAGLTGCNDLFSVSRGGTVILVVADVETQMGVPGVTATLYLRDAPGGELQISEVTDTGGEATFEFEQTGRVTAFVELPAGYTEGQTGLTKELVVNRGETITTVFLLLREG